MRDVDEKKEVRTIDTRTAAGEGGERRDWHRAWVILLAFALVALVLTAALAYHLLWPGDTLGR